MAVANTNAVVAGNVDAGFIPELWSDEVVAAYKRNLVFANLVRKLNHRGKKGDTIYIPQPSRNPATRRASLAAYTVAPLAYAESTRITVAINKHTEYSRLFDDFAQVQALESMRRFFVDDAGYAIAQAIDHDIIEVCLDRWLSTVAFDVTTTPRDLIDQDTSVIDSGNTGIDGAGTTITSIAQTAYADITDAGLRTAVRLLDVQDTPMSNRSLIVRPEVKEVLIGLPRFTEQAFVGDGSSIRNGLIGDTYGVEVFVTNQLPQMESSSGDDAIAGNISFMLHSDAIVLVEQLGIRSQHQYQLQYLADLLTTDTIYGVGTLRAASIVPIIT